MSLVLHKCFIKSNTEPVITKTTECLFGRAFFPSVVRSWRAEPFPWSAHSETQDTPQKTWSYCTLHCFDFENKTASYQ